MEKWEMIKRFLKILLLGCPFYSFSQDTTQTCSDTIYAADTRIIFKSNCNEDSLPKISFVHVHEDETTSVKAAGLVFNSINNQRFVTWQCRQQRFVEFEIDGVQYRFDPNRIYTTTGINTTLKNNKSTWSDSAALAVKQVADTFLKKYVDSNLLVVALHNNTNSGGLSVSSYKKGGTYSRDAKLVYANPKHDADDFFYTTEPAYFDFFRSKGFNVVLQDNARVQDDGSLSVYCAKQKIPYINIEAQDGHLVQQVKMLKIVLALISQTLE